MKWANVAAATDNNIEDEAMGQKRIELAAASKQRKKDEAKQMALANAEARRRNQTTALRTDANIEDEAAGQRRLELAALSKERKEAEARALAKRNAEQRRRNAAAAKGGATYRTDMDISDEAAGRRRLELATEAKARREAQAADLAKRAAEMRARNTATAQRTDDDIDDEEAGRWRLQLAEESRQRRIQEARMLKQANVEMRRRLKNMKARTDNHKGGRLDLEKRAVSAGPIRPAEAARMAAEESAERRQEIHEQDEAAELDLLRRLIGRSQAAEKKCEGWNTSPHRPVPYALRGLRPMHSMEPWSRDVMDRCKKEGMTPSQFGCSTGGLQRLDDGMSDDYVALRRRRIEEDIESATATGRPAWNNTVWHYVPPALRGLKPVTPEPWAEDLAVYQAAGGANVPLLH